MTDKPGRSPIKCRRPKCSNLAHPVYEDLCENCWNECHKDTPGHQMMSRTEHKTLFARTQKQNKSE